MDCKFLANFRYSGGHKEIMTENEIGNKVLD